VSTEAHTLHFLVVDDSEEIRDVFCRLVQRAGHRASIAKDGLEALDSLQRESFDVMLLDLSMPRMNGVELVRWLRDHPAVAPDMRIVVVSAWTGEQRGVLQELGVDTLVQKPLRIQQLTDLIAEGLLDRAAPAAGASLDHPGT
jgi:CheY-like chemotaxis protein